MSLFDVSVVSEDRLGNALELLIVGYLHTAVATSSAQLRASLFWITQRHPSVRCPHHADQRQQFLVRRIKTFPPPHHLRGACCNAGHRWICDNNNTRNHVTYLAPVGLFRHILSVLRYLRKRSCRVYL